MATRRTIQKGLGALAILGGAARVDRGVAVAQGHLRSLQPEEPVDTTMKRLFGSRPIRAVADDGGPIRLDLPLIAEDGGLVPITIEVKSPMTPASHVKAIDVISDRNRRPLNARFTLTPALGLALVGTSLRLGETTDVRAVAELSDGTLLMARREVKVTVGGCGG